MKVLVVCSCFVGLWSAVGCGGKNVATRSEAGADGGIVTSDAAALDSNVDVAAADGTVSETGVVCLGTQSLCASGCVNFDNDAANCGSCGNACTNGQLCVNRVCSAPAQCSVSQDPACTGTTYCNLTTQMCAPGCDGRSGQCPTNAVCDISIHACSCNAPNRMCGNVCAECPSHPQATGFACSNGSCVISSCRTGYSPNSSGGACTTNSVEPFAGDPTALVRPGGAIDFGYGVSISGDGNTVVVGDRGGGGGNGAATVYSRVGNTWSTGTNLMRPPGAIDFGVSVSVSDDSNTVVVGDWNGGVDGTATVYLRTGDGWSTGTNLVPPGDANAFGRSVSVSSDGTTVVVGDLFGGANRNGSATVYLRTASGWNSGTNLMRPSGARYFGHQVSVSGDGSAVAIGDREGGGDGNGAATVYTRTGNSWNNGTNLTRPIGAGRFGDGISVSADGTTIVVGQSRAAMMYLRTANGWSSGTNLSQSTGPSVAVAGDGNTVVVGRNGASAIYWRTGNGWSHSTNTITFGDAVAVSADGNTIVVSHWQGGGDDNGAVHVYTRS